MPVTRSSSSRSLSRQSVLTPSPKRKPGSSGGTRQVSNDVIVLSDGEYRSGQKSKKTSVPKPKPKKTNDKQRGKARAKPLAPICEVFEISSEDEDLGPSVNMIALLQSKVEKLEKENASLKTARKLEVDKKKVVLDASKVEDYISCEICAIKLWRPFILPECGHTFCQSCLEDWFNTTLAQHMTTYPNYDPNLINQLNGLPGQIRDLLANNNLSPQVQTYIQHMYPHYHTRALPPQYTCPTCREHVKNKPVEDFALKSLVTIIAGAAGESSRKKSGGRAKSGPVKRGGTWDAFFRTAV